MGFDEQIWQCECASRRRNEAEQSLAKSSHHPVTVHLFKTRSARKHLQKTLLVNSAAPTLRGGQVAQLHFQSTPEGETLIASYSARQENQRKAHKVCYSLCPIRSFSLPLAHSFDRFSALFTYEHCPSVQARASTKLNPLFGLLNSRFSFFAATTLGSPGMRWISVPVGPARRRRPRGVKEFC